MVIHTSRGHFNLVLSLNKPVNFIKIYTVSIDFQESLLAANDVIETILVKLSHVASFQSAMPLVTK